MRTKKLKAFFLIAGAVLVIDWILGAVCTYGILPYTVFLLANIPFGAIHVWMESHWTGTQYVISGHVVSEMWSFVTFFGVVLAQSCVYFLLWCLWQRKQQSVQKATQPGVSTDAASETRC